MMKNFIRCNRSIRFLNIAAFLLITSCSSQKIEITGDEPFEVRILEPDSFNQIEKQADARLYTFDRPQVINKIIEAKLPGYEPVQYLIIDGSDADLIKLKATPTKEVEEKRIEDEALEANKANPSLRYRMIVEAYQAIVKEDYKKAEGLGIQLTKILPNISVPHIILGLLEVQKGAYGEAKKHLETARSLDPSDENLKSLLDFVDKNQPN